ncbi:hypothetical protein SLS60_009497 [Paraconiothyrium brasiliense]|uniref:Fascin domain-containing protein n=1 Tax=Paraconiothyrium brasiliense TaxID=300254 RepID=A0ABR3QUG6_9PLEO
MKFFAAAAALCTLVAAAPLAPWEVMAPPPDGTQFYQLQTKSATAAVSGQWVALKTGSTTYSLAAQQTAATKFFVNKYAPTNTFAVHNADDTRQLALQGPNGVLLSLVDATNPTTDTIPKGTLMEWATFTMDNNVLFVKDGSTLANRTFVAVKGSGSDYSLALYDGKYTVDEAARIFLLTIFKVPAQLRRPFPLSRSTS